MTKQKEKKTTILLEKVLQEGINLDEDNALNRHRHSMAAVWVKYEIHARDEGVHFNQEDIDSIKLPKYVPKNLLKSIKCWWSEPPNTFYIIGGRLIIPQSTFKDISQAEFITHMNSLSGRKVLFRGENVSLGIHTGYMGSAYSM